MINVVHEAASDHSDALELWLAARGDEIEPAYARLVEARDRHRALDLAACRASVPPCWRR